jgi:hypothetical protein
MSGSATDDSGKSSPWLLSFSQKARERYPTFQKKRTTIIELLKKIRQGYRDFPKKFTKVTGLFKKCPATFADFLEKISGRTIPPNV